MITADIPGVAKEDLTIKLLNPEGPAGDSLAALLLRGERKPAQEAEGVQSVKRERRRGAFERRLPLPDDGERRWGMMRESWLQGDA